MSILLHLIYKVGDTTASKASYDFDAVNEKTTIILDVATAIMLY